MSTSNKGITRRSFLTTTTLAAGGVALTALGACATPSQSDESDDGGVADGKEGPISPANSDANVYSGTCRGNCGGPCILNALVREGKIVSTFPQTYPSSFEGVEQGCVKGQSNPLRLYGEHRVMYPMKRVGERGAGEWERISWDEAFQVIGEKLTAAREEYGPASVFVQTGAGYQEGMLDGAGVVQMINASTTYDTVGLGRFMKKSGSTWLTIGGDMAGIYFLYYLLPVPMNSQADLANSKTILVWGSNPAEAGFSRSAWLYVCKAREAGAKVITIDPQFTSTAAQSDQWVPVRVGTDSALMCAMANYIVANGLENQEYLKTRSVAPLLVKEDGTYLRVADTGAAPASDEENLPMVWDNAAQAFVAYTEAQDAALNGTFDADGQQVRTVFDAMLENIAPFTVEFAAEECGIPAEQIEELARTYATAGPATIFIDYGVEHSYNSWRVYLAMALLAALTGNAGVSGGAYLASTDSGASVLKAPVELDYSFLEVEDALENKVITGDYIVEIAETGQWAGQDYPCRALIIEACNTIDNFSGANYVIDAYNKLDFIVTIDPFMTTTAQYSDIVLPACMSWEEEDFNTMGIMSQKAIDPLGEAKGDFDIWCGIAKAMGWDDLYPMTREEYLRSILDTQANLDAGLGYDVWHEQGAVFQDYTPASDYVGEEYNELGLTQFYLETMPPRDDWGQTFPMEDRLPKYVPAIESYRDNPLREKYPLHGISSHDNYHGQSLWAHNLWLDNFRTVDGKPFCRIHENAAAERGIQTGDTVRIESQHGACVLKALVTKGIREDTIWVPHGFFKDEFDEGFAQGLSGHYPDPYTSNANFNDWLCQVVKVEGGER